MADDVGRPTLEEVEAAARELHRWGDVHGWWKDGSGYEGLDPISKDEFDAIVERVLMAAQLVKAEKTDCPLDGSNS